MNQATENIRFLLWNNQIEKSSWISVLSEWAGCSEARAKEILKGGYISTQEQDQIAKRLNLGSEGAERLQMSRLLVDAEIDILRTNLEYLLGELAYGEKGELAKRLGVKTETLRRWKVGAHNPQQDNLDSLSRALGLKHGIDLSTDPLFLSMSALGEKRRKQWLKKQISNLNAEELNDLFPALERLLRDT